MTDHLPECPLHKGCQCPWIAECADCACICPELRACEERIYSRDIFMDAWMKGRNAGLDVAEAAVAEDDIPPRWWKSMFFGGRRARHWCQYGWDWKKRDARSAIRALKEKP